MSEIIVQDTIDDTLDSFRDLGVSDTQDISIDDSVISVDDDIMNEVSEAEPLISETMTPLKDEDLDTITPVAVADEKPAPVVVQDKPLVEASIVSATTPEIPETLESTVDATPKQMDSDSDDASYPSFALKIFLASRQGFIILFDIILTGVAIILERLAMINWSGMIQTVISVFRGFDESLQNRVSSKIRLSLYALTVILLLGLPIGKGMMNFFSDDNLLDANTSSNTVTVSQDNSAIIDNGILAPLFTPTVQHWAGDIARWTSNTDISPDMLAVVMQLESCGNPNVAGGLFGIADSESTFNDPEIDAQTALAQLQSALLLSNNDWAMALAIYADGDSVLQNDFMTWTFHGRDMYILGRNFHTQAQAGLTTSSDLESWMQNTGSILCTQAQTTLNG